MPMHASTARGRNGHLGAAPCRACKRAGYRGEALAAERVRPCRPARPWRSQGFWPLCSWRENPRLRKRAGMSLEEDERLRSDAEAEGFLRSVAPGS
jgi:hypothetical protein